MRIAVIGSGISGLVVAHRTHRDHDLTVFEADDRVGGHTHTQDVSLGDRRHAVDSGFIVFNLETYPHFVDLLRELGVPWKASTMSFSVRCERTGLEYRPSSLRTLFVQKRNLVRPAFWRMLRDVLRFRARARPLLGSGDARTLREWLAGQRFSRELVEWFLVPMGAAIWSADPDRFLDIPVRFFVEFLENHRFLSVRDQPRWLVVRGGSRTYVEALTAPFRDRIRLSRPVRGIRRQDDGVDVRTDEGTERFDEAVVATHSDQALALLEDPSPAEREILGAIPYQTNSAVLHTDVSLLPRRRRAWASWNYRIPAEARGRVAVTYDMNILQGLGAREEPLVTLNGEDLVDPSRVIERMTYAHPVFTPEGRAAQARYDEIGGVRRTHFCGAYWRYGFHEDGAWSGLRVARALGAGAVS